MQRPLLEVVNVSFSYGTAPERRSILRQISFEVPEGEFVAVVGPSGAGKTTLFNLLAGLATPDTGFIRLAGKPVADQRRMVGYMLQKDLLFPWRTVLENVLLGVDIHGRPRTDTLGRAHDYLNRYGLGSHSHAYPNQLSGGMRQRVALIRTLMINPALILLDEPFSALDYQTRLQLEHEMLKICKQEGRTVMLVTHDIGEAISLADRVVVLGDRPTTIKAVHAIRLTLTGEHTPWHARKAPEYPHYFDLIWGELQQSLAPKEVLQ